ncbi:MAG TPA: indolepyruvate oxidoreductase subunit beta [Methanobacterium sp.]|jgi:indolepyruvate ferredoxin oxidoreductase beta subunit|nr:MAG: indolepyruvate oxidoreductase subunit beta [Methanobacterium sp.]HOI70744.1 indolepyruvate oxidoreductase subunit beta [Methanobacterium sp.]
MKTYNIYICGVGGQGIIKTSIVMGEAAMKIGKSVVMSEIHGMAQRGGVVSTELRIGQSHSPLIGDGEADLILAFEPLEALRSIEKISEDGCVVTNTAPIMPFNINDSDNKYPKMDTILKELESRSGKMYALNALEIAKKAGHILSLNMVMLGGAAAVPNFPIDRTELKESMKDNLPDKSLEINNNAFDYGFNIVNSK